MTIFCLLMPHGIRRRRPSAEDASENGLHEAAARQDAQREREIVLAGRKRFYNDNSGRIRFHVPEHSRHLLRDTSQSRGPCCRQGEYRRTWGAAVVKGWVCKVAAKVRGRTTHVTLEKYLNCGTMDSGQSNTVQFLLLPLAA